MESLFAAKKSSRLKNLLILLLCTAIIYFLSDFPFLAEYVFARGVTRFIGFVLNTFTNYIPVSFYEFTALFLIAGGISLAAVILVLTAKKRFALVRVYLYRLVSAVVAVVAAFGLTYAPMYERYSSLDALGLTLAEVNEEKIYAAAEYFVNLLAETSSSLSRDKDRNVLPTSEFNDLASEFNAGFDKLNSDYFNGYKVIPKKVSMSVPMSYLGITGIYFPFYAESNLNVNVPPYTLPFTMAHEMAHAKGISRENEANGVAYALCLYSSDSYIRYSGLMNASAYLINRLNEEKYQELVNKLPEEILAEYANANAHYEKYEGVIDEISSFFNDLFLKSNGVQSGISSYGETAETLVALYEKLNN